MSSKFKSVWLLAACVCLILGTLAIATDSEKQGSILGRVQIVDDPELGELIRIAIENSPEMKMLDEYRLGRVRGGVPGDYQELAKAAEAARLKIVRCVTETYAQIKLLDTQIAQIHKKIKSSKTTEAVQMELFLAKAELEAKRTTELANLREVMNIIPKHAFGRIPASALKSWLVLDVINDDVVHVFKKHPKGFTEADLFSRYAYLDSVKLTSPTEVISYLKDVLKSEEHRPLRVVIMRKAASVRPSEELHKQIIQMAKEVKLQMEIEVYLDDRTPQIRRYRLYLKEGKIYRDKIDLEENKPDRGGEQGFYKESIPHLLYTPGNLPLKVTINFDAESKDLAVRMSKAIKEAAKKLGAEKLVEIEQKEFGPNEIPP